MSYQAEWLRQTGSVTPSGMARQLRSNPHTSSAVLGWPSITLQRFKFQTEYRVEVSEMRDYVIALQLGGPVSIEEELDNGRTTRRWFETGTMNLVPPGQTSKRLLKGDSDVLTLSISPKIMRDVFEEVFDRDPNSISFIPELAVSDEAIRRLCIILMNEAQIGGAGSSLMAEAIARALALQLIRAHSNIACSSCRHTPPLPAGRMCRIIEYMKTHLEEDLALKELANLAGLGRSQFVKAFIAETGSPPHRFLVALRIEKARELLEHSDKPVIEVGMICGFSQPAHFATSFRKINGLSPRAWRVARVG